MLNTTRQRPFPPAASAPPAPARGESDAVLVERLRSGDQAALAGLVDGYHRMLLYLATTFVASREAAEDVVQETWLAVIDGLDRLEGRPSLRSWICAIAVRRAKARARKDGRAQPLSAVEPADPAWAGRTPEAVLAMAETSEALERAVSELPATMRAVIVLRDIEGLSPAETCHALGISDVNQRVTLHRARVRLQRAIAAVLEEEA